MSGGYDTEELIGTLGREAPRRTACSLVSRVRNTVGTPSLGVLWELELHQRSNTTRLTSLLAACVASVSALSISSTLKASSRDEDNKYCVQVYRFPSFSLVWFDICLLKKSLNVIE